MEELTVQIQKPIIPPLVWNKEAVEQFVNDAISKYTGRVYTADMIDGAKKDRAKLNALEKQLAKAFTATKNVYLDPLAELETTTKDLRQKIKATSTEIDVQVKAYEDAEKADKRAKLEAVYTQAAGTLAVLVPIDKIFDSRWLNKTTPFSTAEKELKTIIEEKRLELDDLADDCEPGEEYEAVRRAYLKNLSMKEARAERKAYRDYKAQQEQAAAAKAAEEAARRAAPVIQRPTAEDLEIKAQAAQNVEMSKIIDDNGRLDFSSLRAAQPEPQPEPVQQPKVFERTLHVRYTAEQGRELIAALDKIGLEYKLI